MKLISEEIRSNVEPICEEVNGKKFWYIEGVYAQAEVENGNRRIYPSKVLMPECEKYIEEKVNTQQAVGELDHPTRVETKLQEASHLITKMKVEKNDVTAKARLLDTTNGLTAQKLLEGGVRLGVSTRGVGSVTERNGQTFVDHDYKLVAVDIVCNPSAPNAFVNGIMESVEFFLESGILRPKQVKIHKEQFTKRATKEDKLSAWKGLFESIRLNIGSNT